jgi:HK97 gp10 family phage protein
VKAALTGVVELRAALREFGIQADKELAAIVRGTAQNIRTHAVKSIQRGPKTGVTYRKKRGGKNTDGVLHRASAPGEAPANDTGRLAGAIKADINGKQAEVVADTEYAAWLEFGTRDIEPRPFMVPAMEKERPAWDRRLNGVVDKAAKGIIK